MSLHTDAYLSYLRFAWNQWIAKQELNLITEGSRKQIDVFTHLFDLASFNFVNKFLQLIKSFN